MAVSKNRKQQQLEALIEKFQNAKSIFFSEYTGISVKGFSKVRDTLRESNVECKVAKKTLIKLAAEQIGIKEIPTEALEGPIAVILSNEDEIVGAKLISNLKKEHETLELTGGIFDGEAFGQEKAKAYAAIPAKEELLAKLVGSMKAPITGFHGVTHGVMRQFVGTLQAIVDKEQ
ncbi:50S ribosomal protein L10 [bacterium]|jgi:large subunit ribosomal protein L10|nr:50S ribosomal protein L10 [bacterium]MBT6293928.1 50S ribosomal protein L10 [bacterium]